MVLKYVKTSFKDLQDIISKSKIELNWNINNSNIFYRIIDNEVTVGFFSINTDDMIILHHVYLSPEFRRCGYGTALIEFMLSKYDFFAIDTPNNAMINLLERMGLGGYNENSNIFRIISNKIVFVNHDIVALSENLDDNCFVGTKLVWYAPDDTAFLMYLIAKGILLICTNTKFMNKLVKRMNKKKFRIGLNKYRRMFLDVIKNDDYLRVLLSQSINTYDIQVNAGYPLLFKIDNVVNIDDIPNDTLLRMFYNDLEMCTDEEVKTALQQLCILAGGIIDV